MQYILAPADSYTLSKIALQGMEEGYDSPGLIILAGMGEKENPFVVDEYFKQMLRELDLSFPNKEQAVFLLIKLTIDRLQGGQIDPYDAAEFIFEQLLLYTDFRERDKNLVYDSIGLERIYGLYVQIDDLRNAANRWDSVKDNATLLEEYKEEIKGLLKNWNYEGPLN